MTLKPQITFEVEETIVLKQGGKRVREFCPRCGRHVDMVSPDVLALVAGATEREVFRMIECGEIYFIESGRVVACLGCYRQSTSPEPNAAANLNQTANI